MSDEFDYIVVGGGTAGACVAKRLSANPDARVLLLEAGPPATDKRINESWMPNLATLWADPRYSFPYPIEPSVSMGNRYLSLLRGRMLGGCSSNNAMIHVRGDRQDYDRWADAGCSGWSYDEVLPFFKRSERFEGGASAYRGGDGPISVSHLDNPTPAATGFVDVAKSMGFTDAVDQDLNRPDLTGRTGYFQFAVDSESRERSSSATGYLTDTPANLVVKTEHQALRILLEKKDDGRCVARGVTCLHRRQLIRFKATSEVILCAGALSSPHLLMLSGVGPEADLRKVGIDPMLLLPVGQNLQDHIIVVCWFETNEKLASPPFISEATLYADLRANGAGTEPTHGNGPPNIQFFAHAGIDVLKRPETPDEYMVIAPTFVRPESRGRISLHAADPRLPPRVDPGYLADGTNDMNTLLAGLDLATQIADAHPAVRKRGKSNLNRANRRDPTGFIRTNAEGLWHPAGSCRMGPEGASDSVVDPSLRVQGIDGLRVADASIMPQVVGSNTNPATLMIAEKAAAMVLASANGS